MHTSSVFPAAAGPTDHGSLQALRTRLRHSAGARPSPGPGEPLRELARMAGYRVERARQPGCWLLIDPDGELVRTPSGEKAWPAEAAARRLSAVAPPSRVQLAGIDVQAGSRAL